jgi:Rps23 Pro-64 3,4-dihydroxylase Tpa1-like proline 4-hydroxylase
MILAAFGNFIVSHKMQLSYIAPATVQQLKKEFTEEFSTRILVRGKWNFVFTSVEEYLQQQ